MNVFVIYFVLAGLPNIYSKIINPSLTKDKGIKNEPKTTENYKLYSNSENSTFVDNSSKESREKSNILILFSSNSVINLSFSAKSVSFFISLKNVLIIKHNTKAKKIFGLKTVCMA